MVNLGPSMFCFEIRQVDSYREENDSWTWNTSYRLSDFSVADTTNIPRKFIRELKKLGITFKPGRTLIYDHGDLLEVVDRKTKQPLFAALML